jgi:hypothetical protein
MLSRYSRYSWTYLLRLKSDALPQLKHLLEVVFPAAGFVLKHYHTDNTGELSGKEWARHHRSDPSGLPLVVGIRITYKSSVLFIIQVVVSPKSPGLHTMWQRLTKYLAKTRSLRPESQLFHNSNQSCGFQEQTLLFRKIAWNRSKFEMSLG